MPTIAIRRMLFLKLLFDSVTRYETDLTLYPGIFQWSESDYIIFNLLEPLTIFRMGKAKLFKVCTQDDH